jgi:hypothetical protein
MDQAMLILNPTNVKFGANVWSDAISVVVDRNGEKVTLQRGDFGPHNTFVDVPEQRVVIRVTRGLARDDLASPKPSEQAELVFYSATSGSDSLRKRVRATCVITSVVHEISRAKTGMSGRPGDAVQTITLVALSSDGVADPIVVEDASDGVL